MRAMMASLGMGAAAGMIAAAVWSQAAEPVRPQSTLLLTADLTADPSREVRVLSVELAPGADSGPHFHHGDQYSVVEAGEIHLTVGDAPERVYKVGESAHVPPMTVHRNRNTGDRPARTIEFFIVEKGQPFSERAE